MEFDTFELTANNYPVLQNNENIINRQNNVTILANKQKFQRGIIYLTNLRLLWLKAVPSKTTTIAINLEDILSKETNSNILSASTIKLVVRKPKKKDNISSTVEGKTNVTLEDWECQICNQVNSGADTVCVLCGVPKIEEKTTTEDVENKPKKKKDITPSNSINRSNNYSKSVNNNIRNYNNNNNLSSLSYTSLNSNKPPVAPTPPPKDIKIECPACTYINEGEVGFCKVCMTKLDGVKPLPPERTKPIICSICLYSNEPNATICSICSMPLKYCASTLDDDYNQNNNNSSLFYSPPQNYVDISKPVHYPNLAETSNISVPDGYNIKNPYSNISLDDTTFSSRESLSDGNDDDDDDDDDDDNIISPISSPSRTSSQGTSYNNKEETIRVKLLFKSGQAAFYNNLCNSLKEEQWKVTVVENKTPKIQRVGVAGVIRNIQESQKNTSEIMNQAFQDLNNLMKKASEMVAIAESISQKINKDNTLEGSKEQLQLKEIMQELGISNPVTKRSTGGVYYQELAKQVSKFIIKLFEKNSHVMTLPDIYCLYNRARGVELVSPEDLYKACNMFEKLQIPLKLRKFQSGLIIVEDGSRNDGEICDSISNYIKNNSNNNTRGINSIELSKGLKIPIILMNEYLKIAEYSGSICRDETIEGVYYYVNLFV